MMPTCSVKDCVNLAIRRGWCYEHYNRWMKYLRDPDAHGQLEQPKAPERKPAATSGQGKAFIVYRAYDKTGRLLYVGVTSNVRNRLGQHRNEGALWVGKVASVDEEPFPTREKALAAEAEAIRTEWPLWNVRGSADSTAQRLRQADKARKAEAALARRRAAQADEPAGEPAAPPPPTLLAVLQPSGPASELRAVLDLLRTAVDLLAAVVERTEDDATRSDIDRSDTA